MSNIKIDRIKSKKKIIIGSLVSVMLIVTLILITSKAKYKNIESIDLASGTINYTPADIDIVAINIENESGNYENVDTIPTSGYTLSSESYCNANGVKDTNVVLTYQNGKVGASNITKRIKCYLYFDKYSAIDTIIGDTTGIQEKTSFTGIATSTDTGIYKAPDDYGTSYYFRGVENQLNNWVKFADFYWRIIRINGNGTIRIIYQGVANGNPSSSNKTGITTEIEKNKYNSIFDDNTYIGYMKSLNNNGNTENYIEAHSNLYNSDIKTTIDNWYKVNIIDKGFNKNIDVNTGFCNDREIAEISRNNYNNLGYGTNNTAYKGTDRLLDINWNKLSTQIPTLKCSNKTRDLFTISTSDSGNIGNKRLTYPVGMITSDETIFAGGFYGTINKTYYLYTNEYYWTMSPYHYDGSYARVFRILSDGNLFYGNVFNTDGIRPVINLRADTEFTGSGSSTDPYVVV